MTTPLPPKEVPDFERPPALGDYSPETDEFEEFLKSCEELSNAQLYGGAPMTKWDFLEYTLEQATSQSINITTHRLMILLARSFGTPEEAADYLLNLDDKYFKSISEELFKLVLAYAGLLDDSEAAPPPQNMPRLTPRLLG